MIAYPELDQFRSMLMKWASGSSRISCRSVFLSGSFFWSRWSIPSHVLLLTHLQNWACCVMHRLILSWIYGPEFLSKSGISLTSHLYLCWNNGDESIVLITFAVIAVCLPSHCRCIAWILFLKCTIFVVSHFYHPMVFSLLIPISILLKDMIL